MGRTIWQHCVEQLQDELPLQQFDTCIKPLQARRKNGRLELLAPNRYVRDQVKSTYLARISELLGQIDDAGHTGVEVSIGNAKVAPRKPLRADGSGGRGKQNKQKKNKILSRLEKARAGRQALNKEFTFDTFVEGKSNELAKAAALQVADRSVKSDNPLLLYGGVGLGKTHLMQAVGNHFQQYSPKAKLVYVHSQGFVQDMVDALREGTMRDFTEFYRSAEALLIDDIQFFAKKLRSQEELFHLFNGLQESGHQMVFTCDRYPSEIDDLEQRLKSRFIWGLTMEVEPPELETRVAILLKKAEAENVALEPQVAFAIAERIRSNVRELEGALRRVVANARFTGNKISVEQAKRALRDLFAIQDRQMSIANIQRVVAEYYKIKISEILSKRRNQNIARPRQMAMFLSRQLTNRSLPEIGEAFNGRDHTTVLHACRKIRSLMDDGAADMVEDHRNLSRLLSA